jgi:hypothetical protein
MESKIIVYKGTGGLFHNLSGVVKSIDIAIENNYFLIIDMKKHSVFGGTFSDFFVINNETLRYSDNYEDYEDYEKCKVLSDIKEKGALALGYKAPGYKRKYDLNSTKINIFYGYIEVSAENRSFKHINVCEPIFNRIKDENKIDKRYLSLHFRNTDIKNDNKLFIKNIKKALSDFKIDTIYVASDDSQFYIQIFEEFKDVNIIQKTFPNKNISNLHYTHPDKYKQQYECLQDVYNILNSEVFIPSINSSMSRSIIHMIKNNYSIFPGLIPRAKIIKSLN